jgi:iron complex transport system substrate-binding protein
MRFRTVIAAWISLAIVAGGCAGSSAGEGVESSTVPTSSSTERSTGGGEGFPVTVDAPNGAVVIDAPPERIVSISPTSTEVLFAIGAGDQVVAVDSLSTYPDAAPVTDLSAFTPNIEAIAALDPDLVFLSYDPTDVIAGLEAIGVPVILHPTATDLDDAFAQWLQVGRATGHAGDAEALVDSTQAALAAIIARLPSGASELSYYWEVDDTYYSITSATFIGELLAGTSMANIADDADPDGYGYPQLSAEYIVARDPDVILLADVGCCGQSIDTVSERPGWGTMTAVQTGSVIELDDDIASRWGPRITTLLDDVVDGIVEAGLGTP